MESQVRLWEVSSGRLRLALAGHSEKVVSCGFGGADGAGAPGLSRAVSCAHDGSIRVWDLQRGAKVPLPRVSPVFLVPVFCITLP